MTAARRRQQPALWLTALYFALAVLGSQILGPAGAATTERIVVDRHTGLALYGFDPVAYFTDAKPLAGRAEFELWLEGATWRFRNEGNRAAFADRPDVYMPRFGGYDPTGIARGVAVPGNPRCWLVTRERLYFFESDRARDAFAADPDRALAVAETQWAQLVKSLVP
jgi:hypothetical protein